MIAPPATAPLRSPPAPLPRPARLSTLAALALAASVAGCAGPAPAVEILRVSPEALRASDDAADDLTLTVHYFDADGDLGQGTASILDCRADGLVTVLPIPRIAGDEAVLRGVPIEGEASLVVADVGVVEPSAAVPPACADLGVSAPAGGARSFCVILADAAGHESEGSCTQPIPVTP